VLIDRHIAELEADLKEVEAALEEALKDAAAFERVIAILQRERDARTA
jgi:predicted phage-related endonuclease